MPPPSPARLVHNVKTLHSQPALPLFRAPPSAHLTWPCSSCRHLKRQAEAFSCPWHAPARWGFDQLYARTLVNMVLDWSRISSAAGPAVLSCGCQVPPHVHTRAAQIPRGRGAPHLGMPGWRAPGMSGMEDTWMSHLQAFFSHQGIAPPTSAPAAGAPPTCGVLGGGRSMNDFACSPSDGGPLVALRLRGCMRQRSTQNK
eukprot:360255-Chlamydomonas_euryale.AAC.12